MDNISLQIEKTILETISAGSPVVFDSITTSSGDINYNVGSGIITFEAVGRYLINWWVATQASTSTNGVVFSLSSSQGDLIKGNSSIKTGEVYGTAIIDIDTAPVTLSLINESTSDIYCSSQVPVLATLTILEQPEAPVGPTLGSIIPINTTYMYIYNDFVNDYYNQNFIVPVNSILEKIILSAELSFINIETAVTGTVHYNIYTTPLGSSTQTLVTTGDFVPTVNELTPIGTILIVNVDVNIPLVEGDMVTLSINYTTDDASSSAVSLDLTGGLLIVPSP